MYKFKVGDKVKVPQRNGVVDDWDYSLPSYCYTHGRTSFLEPVFTIKSIYEINDKIYYGVGFRDSRGRETVLPWKEQDLELEKKKISLKRLLK